MKKTIALAAALSLLTIPALAQQSPTGQSTGGPAREANPGMSDATPGAAPTKTMTKKKAKRSSAKHRKQPM